MSAGRGCTPLESAQARDWVRRPVGIIFWWVIPLALGMSTNWWHQPLEQTALVWAVSLAWMGTGCTLNALRCRRRHCFISGPVLLLGAIAAGLVALGVLPSGNALGEAVNGTLAVAASSFLSECLWGVYAGMKTQ